MQSISQRIFAASVRNRRLIRRASLFFAPIAYFRNFCGSPAITRAEPKKPASRNFQNRPHITQAKPKNPASGDEKKTFDITKEWGGGVDFFKKMILTSDVKESKVEEKPPEVLETRKTAFGQVIKAALLGPAKKDQTDEMNQVAADSNSENDFFAMARTFAKLSTGDRAEKEKMVQELMIRVRETTGKGDFEADQSLTDILSVLQTNVKVVTDSLDRSFGNLDLSQLSLTSLYYYLEREDAVKNPSWKRRMHRFHSGIDINRVSYLNDMLYLSNLSYVDKIEEIAEGCKNAKEPLELVYCDLDGRPNKPSHFIAVKKDQSIWSSELEVTIVVRGTKTLTDMMTDCVVDAVDYRGGKAHSGILQSGNWIVSEHTDLLERLRLLARKRYVKVKLVGHSLGAGAAAIAGVEFDSFDNYNVEVVGFGCPSVLSPELSKKAERYITTVISDSDCVPRMSGATVANALLNIMEYDWTPHARRDIEHALGEVRQAYPYLLSKVTADSLMGVVDDMLETYVKPTIKPPTTDRVKPVLCPPGVCVHLYKDGSGIAGSISPGTFFQEIDVTRRLIDDHFISSGYEKHLLDLMRQYTNDHNFRFDENTKRLVGEYDQEVFNYET